MHENAGANLGIFLKHSKFHIVVQVIIFTIQTEVNISQAY